MTKDEIKTWQTVLVSQGCYAGDIDGDYGSRTVDGTKRYQGILRELGLYRGEIDGVAGRLTLDAHSLNVGKSRPARKGTDRTDWRGFVQVDVLELAAQLPRQAQSLAALFIRNAVSYDLNPLFLVAISKHETAAWTSNAFRNRANAMGISNPSSVSTMPSHNDSIVRACASLTRKGGYYAKCKTLADVGRVYAPVGAANDPGKLNSYWPGLVAMYWAELEEALGKGKGTR
jgi:peptidoglycan hydrolase-like protein with peptidoglycan-binding domain